ncbi:Saccharopine dehydrogenase-domain-containing protein [Coniella lustricola]|uniref:Saccharopine dehydrogenase-domain-containing protein n=1 Tax=Coniella lustricola TaxID=2025994 RepID=A0A2T3AF65_9PEZI|nr:Saccharopine dehydrogenase-domain-containing protein [Coniella lustricola]
MPFKKHDRQYDLVVFGATGYTGKYTSQSITRDLPTDLRWAIAGRSRGKLEKLAEELKSLNPDRLAPEIEICELNDEDLASLARKTFVLITTVGPYGQYGEHAFKACAQNGTHYLDVTGEVPYVAKMIKKYESVAKKTGSMLFPQTGVESAPADLLTWALAKQIRQKFEGAKTAEAIVSIHRLNSSPSGGTLATLISFNDMFSLKEIGAALTPYALSPVPNPQAKHQKQSLWSMITGLRTVPELGLQTTFIGATTDRAIVHRSWGLFQQISSRKDEFYGPQFRFSQHMKTRNWLTGIAIHWTIITATILLTVLSPLRKLVKRFVYEQGQGPDFEEAKKEEIEYRAVGMPEGINGELAYCQAAFRGSMYDLTGVILAQSALTILEDDLDLGGGVFTPACLGQGVIDRLDASGFRFETKTLTR